MNIPKDVVKKYLSLIIHEGSIIDKQTSLNFRCPFCGDSNYSYKKQRGNIKFTDEVIYFKCFNCGMSLSVRNFFKELNKDIYNDFIAEIREINNISLINKNKSSKQKKSIKELLVIKKEKSEKFDINKFLRYLNNKKIVNNEDCVKYLNKRKIPLNDYLLNNLYYIENIKKMFNRFFKKRDITINGNGILIPAYDLDSRFIGFQIRLFGNTKLRYFGIKIYENVDTMYFNIPNVDFNKKIIINEGFFDGCFLNNSISVAGITNIPILINRIFEKKIKPENIYVVLDNEKYNKGLTNILKRCINMNVNIFIWDKNEKSNDINNLAIEKNIYDLTEYVYRNSYKGIKAKLKLSTWLVSR